MSFQQGLSGLNVSAKNLDIIGNNIANANTYGAKSSRAEFADVYAASLNGNGVANAGIGVRLSTVAQQFSQGNITSTDNSMDLAINGAGFFQLSDGTGTFYSRNGQFKVDKSGYIVNNDGKQLLGFPAETSTQGAKAVALQLPTGGIAPSPTSKVSMEFNLDSRSTIKTPATAPLIDFASSSTYNNSTSLTVYDVKGESVALGYYFQKSAVDASGNTSWDVYVTADGVTVEGTAGAPAKVGTLTFPADGSAPTPTTLTLDAAHLSTASGNTFTNPVTIDVSNATQFGSSFGVTDLSQNGFAAGALNSITVDKSGQVVARYSNGQTQSAGQVVLATFRNNQGLQSTGGNCWIETATSGNPTPGKPGEGNLGAIQAGALEESNVDLTAELVNMITAQRNYQANAQTIKTMDQVMQTLVNLR